MYRNLLLDQPGGRRQTRPARPPVAGFFLARHFAPSRRRPSPPRWLVYLLRCSDGSLYTGITNDLNKRLKAHAAGKASRYTRSRLAVRLICSEPHEAKSAALKRVAAIKKLRRAEKEMLLKPTPARRQK